MQPRAFAVSWVFALSLAACGPDATEPIDAGADTPSTEDTGTSVLATFLHLLPDEAQVEVYVDDASVGPVTFASATFSSLGAGTHVVRFDRPGSAPVTRSVDVAGGRDLVVALHGARGTPEILVMEANPEPSDGYLVRVIHTNSEHADVEASLPGLRGLLAEPLSPGEVGPTWTVSTDEPHWLTVDAPEEATGLSYLLPRFAGSAPAAIDVWLTHNGTNVTLPERPFIVISGSASLRIGHDAWVYFVNLAAATGPVDVLVDSRGVASGVGEDSATPVVALPSESRSYDVSVSDDGLATALVGIENLPLAEGTSHALVLVGGPVDPALVVVNHARRSAGPGARWASLTSAVTARPSLAVTLRQRGVDLAPRRVLETGTVIEDIALDATTALEVAVDVDGDGTTDQTLDVPPQATDVDIFLVRPDPAADAVELRIAPTTGGGLTSIAP